MLIALAFVAFGVLGICGALRDDPNSKNAATRNQRILGFLLVAIGTIMLLLIAGFPRQ